MRGSRGVIAAFLLLLASAVGAQAPVSDAGAKVLARPITIAASNELLTDVLTSLRQEMKVPLAWSGDVIPAGFRVSLTLRNTPLRGMLAAILSGSGLQYVVTPAGTVVIIPQHDAPAVAARATDTAETRHIARAIAATGVQQLDAVVVTGNAVATRPGREQPTAIDIVNSAQLAGLPNGNVADVMRTMLPGIILWDRGFAGPPAPIAAVRGVSSFTTRALKTYVDGIELASPELFTLVDARSIERIEVIRGPQGAALYGPDALNGILQIETRHGRFGNHAPDFRGSASAGSVERADTSGTAFSQDYTAGVTGGTPSSAFDIGGAFSHVGQGGSTPLARTWSLNGAGRLMAGPILLDASARIGHHAYAVDPGVDTSDSRELEERAVAVTALHEISDRWRQTFVAGYHRVSGVREPFRSPLLTPTLPLGATDETASRVSVRYGSVVDISQILTVTGGAEYSRHQVDRSARDATNTTSLLHLYRDDLRSTGAFVQGRAHVGARLVLSGGARGEHLSSVAPGVGTLWASTAGASWSHEFRAATMRLRASWGNGIRAPEPGMNQAMSRGTIRQEPNPDLLPERQRGVETGAEFFFANAAVVKVTWYDQRAIDLIQQVRLRIADSSKLVYQFQNVGVVRNQGIELESSYRWRRLAMTAAAFFPRSKVLELSPTYGGELRRGDRLLEVPNGAGAASVRYDLHGLHAEVGASWIGSWDGYDWQLIRRAEANQATRRDAERDYRRDYSGVTRPYVSLAADLPRSSRVFVRVDNPANTAELIRDNVSPPLGRMVVVGFSVRQ